MVCHGLSSLPGLKSLVAGIIHAVTGRLAKNLYAVLPIGATIGLWLGLVDSFEVVVSSPKLLADIPAASLTVVYAVMATLGITIATMLIISIVVTLVDRKAQLDPSRHAARVTGIIIFIFIMLIGHLLLRSKTAMFHPLDLRSSVPFLSVLFIGWLLGRFVAVYIANTYKPGDWPHMIGAQFAAFAGAAVFIFGTPIAHFSGMKGQFYKIVAVALTLENVLYYVIFLAAGLLVWVALRYFFRRFAHTGIRSVITVFLLLIVIPLLLFCRPAKPDNPDSHNPRPSGKGRNVILISVDTLRYDRLGCNFNEYIRTPSIDELAGESLIFDHCIVPMPVTVPSHISMHTGLMPRNHGVRVQTVPLEPHNLTIAELLGEKGFTCGGIVNVKLLTGQNSGLDQGFHYYDDFWVGRNESRFFPLEIKHLVSGKILNLLLTGRPRSPNRFQRRAEPAINNTLEWLDEVKDEDFFFFLHLFDPHWPYDAPEPYTEMYDPDYDGSVTFHAGQLSDKAMTYDEKATQEDFDHLVARYDGEVTYTDSQLKRLFDHLKKLGLWDETMIILTADHGESFGHDYFFGHILRVYQSCIHVPLIIKPFAGADGERVDALCSNIDFFPTICDALGIQTPDELDGVSLMPFIEGVAEEGYEVHPEIYSESYPFATGDQSCGRTYSLTRDHDKLIYSPYAFPYAPTWRFYGLADDPDEENNLADHAGALFDELVLLLTKWVSSDEGLEMGLLGPDDRETLKGLQYLN